MTKLEDTMEVSSSDLFHVAKENLENVKLPKIGVRKRNECA